MGKLSSLLLAFALCGLAFGQNRGGSSEWKSDGSIKEGEYTHKLELVKEKFVVHYCFDSLYIYLGIEVKNNGWFAVGFNPSRAMKDADMIIFYEEKNELRALDSYSTGVFGPHKGDKDLGGKGDILEFAYKKIDNGYVVEFRRLLNTEDKFDKVFNVGKIHKLIYAMSNGHDISKKHNLVRGSVDFKLEK